VVGWLVGWLGGWMVGWLDGWVIDKVILGWCAKIGFNIFRSVLNIPSW